MNRSGSSVFEAFSNWFLLILLPLALGGACGVRGFRHERPASRLIAGIGLAGCLGLTAFLAVAFGQGAV